MQVASLRRIQLTIAALLLCLGACGSENEKEISQDDYGDKWPFIVKAGMLRCEKGMVVFTPSGGPYKGVAFAVNGTAKQHYRDIKPIWRFDDKLKDELIKAGATSDAVSMLKINIGEIIDRGLELCD